MAERRRAKPAPIVTPMAIAALIAATRRVSSWKTKAWSWAPKVGSVSCVPEMLANVRSRPTRPVTTHTAPEAQAYRAAVIRREVLRASGMIVAAARSRPTVLAAARSWMARTTGSPQRTIAPASGSPATGAAYTPPIRPAGMTTATTAIVARTTGSFAPWGAAPEPVVMATA